MRMIYLLGCIAVVVTWWIASKNSAKEEGGLDVTVENALNLVLLTICSWLGLAKILLSCYMPKLLSKVIYTFNGGDDKQGDAEQQDTGHEKEDD